MREIKFRAWDGEKMVSPDYIRRDGVAIWEENSCVERSSCIMQSTGLKDKNGVEIYEGDVVKWDEKNGGNIEDVQWSEEELAWICHNPKDNGSWLCCADKIGTVIGNIHANPGLLGDK